MRLPLPGGVGGVGINREVTMDLFRCETMRAEITARTCLLNQAKDEIEHGRFHCAECEVGRVIRETNGGKLPIMVKKMGGGYAVIRKKEEDMASLVKIDGEKVFTTDGQPLKASSPEAAAKIVEAVKPTVARPCRNHPDRESVGKERMCRECRRAYQREWHRKEKGLLPESDAKIRKANNAAKKAGSVLISAPANEVEKINMVPSKPWPVLFLEKMPIFDPRWAPEIQGNWLYAMAKIIDLLSGEEFRCSDR